MSREIYWLTLTVGATALFWIPYVLNRMIVRGIGGTLANPSPDDKPLAPWATRARAAHANATENLVLFAPVALAVHVMGTGDQTTDFACALFFYSRLTHFVVYTAGGVTPDAKIAPVSSVPCVSSLPPAFMLAKSAYLVEPPKSNAPSGNHPS